MFKMIMTIERVLTISIKNWRNFYFNSKKALIVIAIVNVAIWSINVPIVLINESEVSYNTTVTWSNYHVIAFFKTNTMVLFALVGVLCVVELSIYINLMLFYFII